MANRKLNLDSCRSCGKPATAWDCFFVHNRRSEPTVVGNCAAHNTNSNGTELYTRSKEKAELWLIKNSL